MAVQNRISPNQDTKKELSTTFEANGLQVTLTPQIVKNYLVSGDKDRVSFQEIAMFINLCKFSGLNPWLKEAYCIKYGTEPATMVVGKEAFMKRAEGHPSYDGMESGIICMNADGDVTYRKGGFKLPEEEIIGGWAEVFRKDREHSTRNEISFEEYAAKKKDGTLNSQWSKKPATMIRKVALVQALREAFPTSFGGMYTAEEQGSVEPEYTVPVEAIEPQETIQAEPSPEPVADVQSALFGGEANE